MSYGWPCWYQIKPGPAETYADSGAGGYGGAGRAAAGRAGAGPGPPPTPALPGGGEPGGAGPGGGGWRRAPLAVLGAAGAAGPADRADPRHGRGRLDRGCRRDLRLAERQAEPVRHAAGHVADLGGDELADHWLGQPGRAVPGRDRRPVR